MECLEYQQELSSLIDGEADGEHAASLFAHLGRCEGCRAFFHSAIRLRDSFAAIRGRELAGEGGMERAARHRQQWENGRPSRNRIVRLVRRRFTTSVVAGLLVCILFCALGVGLSSLLRPSPQVVERRVQETVYVLQLPPVEVNAVYGNIVKAN